VFQLSWLLLGLGLYLSSYRVRELLICWLFFIGIFAALALATSGGVLAWYAGKRAFDWASPLAQLAPEILSGPVELPLEPIPAVRSCE
jgi:uncharacterized SAM-binding protein YcdF (DUF218 family)